MLNRSIFSIVFIGLIVLLGANSTGIQVKPDMQPSDFSAIDTYIESQMSTFRIPGLGLAIIQGDQVVYMRGYGIASPNGEPVTPQTSFIIGSTGKSITASALMMLVEAGKVELDAPVVKYLPWFRLADAQASAKITVRMLLNQNSGIPNGAGRAAQVFTDESEDALEEQVRSFSRVKLSHAPGAVYEYANANYQIVGMIIQAVSGQSFQEFIQEHIYVPLDMRNSYTVREEARQHGMATGYRYWFGFPLPAYNLPYTYRQFPAGWYICSVEDLAHYLIMHMNEGKYRGNTLISADGMAELHRPVMGGYAMGWAVEGSLISHNGGMPDYGSGLYFNNSTHYGVAVVFNANTSYFYTPSYVIAPSILRILTGGQPYQPVPDAQYRIMLPVILGTLLLQIVWVILSAGLLKRWNMQMEKRPKRMVSRILWLLLPLIFELGLAYYIVSTFQTNGNTVLVSYIYQPDLTLLGVISLVLALGWGVTRTVLSLRILDKQPIQRQRGS